MRSALPTILPSINAHSHILENMRMSRRDYFLEATISSATPVPSSFGGATGPVRSTASNGAGQAF